MKEIEVKILEIPKKIAFAKLRKLGARKKYAVFMRVKYFDYPDGRIRKKRDLLRVRELRFLPDGKIKTEVVYKIYQGIKQGCKAFEELEFAVEGKDGFQKMSGFLRSCGFVQTLFYEKRRTLFQYNDWKFEFDEHPHIPPLMEIEAKNPAEIKKILKKLDLEKFETSPETIQELLKRKYPHIQLNGLSFT